jgi:hypothetical protein
MRPTWLFEADVFGTTAESVKAEVRRQGMGCHVIRQPMLALGVGPLPGGGQLPDDACVIFCGTYPCWHFLRKSRAWVPGGWCSADNLACTTYYARFGPHLLNQRYTVLPAAEAVRHRDAVYDYLGRGDEVFVRPNGCQKLFTGRRVARDDFVAALGPARYDPATLVVIAEPRAVGREWRLVVAGGAVIAASQYQRDGALEVVAGCPDAVRSFAAAALAAAGWAPDDIFMMDVCESEGRLCLLELNGFSCSALYECDPRAVVAAASALAVRAWERAGQS